MNNVFDGLMKPDKKEVGKRIKMVKEELNVSLTELGGRLGLSKSRMNTYVQGYSLATVEVLEALSKFSGKTVGWFYFGDMEDYIRAYLMKLGHEKLLEDYPELPKVMEKEFLGNQRKWWDWQNEFGYPYEECMDEVFAQLYDEKMQEYIKRIVRQYLTGQTGIEITDQNSLAMELYRELYGNFCEIGSFRYGEEDKIISIINHMLKGKSYLYAENTCKNCEFNTGICIGHGDGPYKYGEEITDNTKTCGNWKISMIWWSAAVAVLPKDIQERYLSSNIMSLKKAQELAEERRRTENEGK